MKNTNILITGGAGYIGSHIVELLVKAKANVIIYDNLVTGFKKLINKRVRVHFIFESTVYKIYLFKKILVKYRKIW